MYGSLEKNTQIYKSVTHRSLEFIVVMSTLFYSIAEFRESDKSDMWSQSPLLQVCK